MYLDLLTTYTTRLVRRLLYPTPSDPKHVKVRPDHFTMRLQTETHFTGYFNSRKAMLGARSLSPRNHGSRRHTLAFDALHILPYGPKSFILYCLNPFFGGA